MGKQGGGTSWLTVVKRAFRSPPSKENDKKSRRRREESQHDQDEEEEKKREKRRWLFRKPSPNNNTIQQSEAKVATAMNPSFGAEQRHAIAVAAATTAAAEAAVATAQAAVEIIRLTTPSSNSLREHKHYSAILIQTAFRGYLARRALRALKGIVKLQALVRGYNVRKQTKMTLKCMQALLRVQARVRDQRTRLSLEGSRKSMFGETNYLWESRYLPDIRERKSIQSRAGSGNGDDWDDHPRTLEELNAILQTRKEAAALNSEKTLAQAFSQQIWDSSRKSSPSAGDDKEVDERTNWLDHQMAPKQWESNSRSSTDRRETIRILEIDTSRPYCCPNAGVGLGRSLFQKQSSAHFLASPHHRASYSSYPQPPVTPSPSKMKPLQVRSASPRLPKEEIRRSYSTANTPSLRSSRCLNGSLSCHGSEGAGNAATPNYMAATESAKARLRSQSATRQRPSTPHRERVGLAKKRLSYPVPDQPYSSVGLGIGCSIFSQNLRSPSFKSVQAGYVGMEQQSNLSSYNTDSIGGEISPLSTTDLRR